MSTFTEEIHFVTYINLAFKEKLYELCKNKNKIQKYERLHNFRIFLLLLQTFNN